MNTMKNLALTLAFTASAAFANDHVTQAATQARELAADYRKMTLTLKDKNFATQELQQELKEADDALAKIKTLLADYGATNPQLNAAQQKEWKRAQDLMALLEVFHGRKANLLEGDNPHKRRTAILQEAQALVTRADLLEKAVQRLP